MPQSAPDRLIDPLLDVRGLKVQFGKDRPLTVVDGVDLAIAPGEIVGLVGESGCGKTVFSLSLLGLVASGGRITEGEVRWRNRNLLACEEKELRTVRGKEIAFIFQNPQSSLNPARTIGDQLVSVLRLHRNLSKSEAWAEALRLVGIVRLPGAEQALRAYPHQFSGGMCQRVMIAMALSCQPKLLIADEPTASLDVTIQAQIMDLLLDIRREFGMAILLVSHDLGVIARMCDRIAVMYLGRIVELARSHDLYRSPKHPYTQALLRSVPVPDPSRREKLPLLEGETPSPAQVRPGECRFRDRCDQAIARCREMDPPLHPVAGTDQQAACILYP
jgi:peptide/nickel transport system ATP-binding protein